MNFSQNTSPSLCSWWNFLWCSSSIFLAPCLLHSTNIRCDIRQQSFFLHALQRTLGCPLLFGVLVVFRFLFQQSSSNLPRFTLPNQVFGSQNFREYTAVPFPTVVMLVIVGMVCVARQLSREGEHGTGFELSCLSLRSTFLFGQSIVGFASYCKADHSRTKAFSFFEFSRKHQHRGRVHGLRSRDRTSRGHAVR